MGENSQLLNKVLEIVEVMGEMRQQLSSFINKCAEKDEDTAKSIDEIQHRISAIELEGSKIVRELLKEESSKLNKSDKLVCELENTVTQLKIDIETLKNDKKIINWKVGVIISFISITVTLLVTWLFNNLLSLIA